jgi:hypothetical protein
VSPELLKFGSKGLANIFATLIKPQKRRLIGCLYIPCWYKKHLVALLITMPSALGVLPSLKITREKVDMAHGNEETSLWDQWTVTYPGGSMEMLMHEIQLNPRGEYYVDPTNVVEERPDMDVPAVDSDQVYIEFKTDGNDNLVVYLLLKWIISEHLLSFNPFDPAHEQDLEDWSADYNAGRDLYFTTLTNGGIRLKRTVDAQRRFETITTFDEVIELLSGMADALESV